MNNLGLLYTNGPGVTQDFEKALESLQKAADAGIADAMNNLGLLYRSGQGVAQDFGKAREWFQKAADAGIADAVKTVRIDRLVGPFWWVKSANCWLQVLAVVISLAIIPRVLRGEFDPSLIGWTFILIPLWIACCKYVNVVDILDQKYAISSLLMVGVPAIMLGLLTTLSGETVDNPSFIPLGVWPVLGGSIAVLAALAVWRLRQRRIDPLGVKLIDLVSTLSQQRAPNRLCNIAAQWPLLGLVLIATVVTTALGTFNLFKAIFVGFAVFFIIPLARSAFQPNANSLLKADSRRPILLLRSFIDDERMSELTGIKFVYFHWLFERYNWRSFIDDEITSMKSESLSFDSPLESRFACHFARCSPFIAVGAPSQWMSITGAARIKLTDLEWRDQVVRWIDDSIIILMMAGMTEWLEWELKQVIAHNALGKLIICFPPVRRRKWKDRSLKEFSANMEERLDRLRRAFAETRWSAELLRLDDAKSLRSLVFGNDGRVTVIRAESRDRNAYHLAVLVGHWVSRAGLPSRVGLPDAVSRAGAAMPAPKGRRFWFCCGLAAALFACGYGALMFCREAMNDHGLMYTTGQGAAQDYGEARERFQKAADAGNADAMASMGWLYEKGYGVAQDYGKAREWFQKAADAGNTYAMANLGELYEKGYGVAQDYGKAREWFQKTAHKGNKWAMSELGWLYEKGFGVAQDYGKAREWFQKPADAGNADAMASMGSLYENGYGVAQDYGKAREWYQKAADAGNKYAKLALLRLH